MSYNKEYEPFSPKILHKDNQQYTDKSNEQIFETDSKNSFELENLKNFIQGHILKIISIQEKIDKINEIKLENYGTFQEQSNFFKNETDLRTLNNNYKSKWLKTEMQLKILEQKKIYSQIELLTVMKNNMFFYEKILDPSLSKSVLYSFLDSHFEGKNLSIGKNFLNANDNLQPESDTSLNDRFNLNNNNNNSNYSISKMSVSQNRNIFKDDINNFKISKTNDLYENEELPTKYIIKNIRIKILRIAYLLIMKIFVFFSPPIKPSKEDKIFYIKKILFSIVLVLAIYYSFNYYNDSVKNMPTIKEQNIERNFYESILFNIEKNWITISSLISY